MRLVTERDGGAGAEFTRNPARQQPRAKAAPLRLTGDRWTTGLGPVQRHNLILTFRSFPHPLARDPSFRPRQGAVLGRVGRQLMEREHQGLRLVTAKGNITLTRKRDARPRPQPGLQARLDNVELPPSNRTRGWLRLREDELTG